MSDFANCLLVRHFLMFGPAFDCLIVFRVFSSSDFVMRVGGRSCGRVIIGVIRAKSKGLMSPASAPAAARALEPQTMLGSGRRRARGRVPLQFAANEEGR
jgi:hypothetical protein